MKKFFSFLKKRPTISSHLLILLSTLYFGFVLNLSFWSFIFKHVEINNFAMFWFTVSLPFFICIPLYILFNLLLAPKVTKPLLILLLLLASSTNYMMFHFGIYIDKDMIQNVFETNIREATDLITFSLLLWVTLTGIIPSLLLMRTRIVYRSLKKEVWSRTKVIIIGLLVIALFAGTAFKEYATFGRNNRQIKGLINPINVVAGTIGYVKKVQLARRSFQILDEKAKHAPYQDELYTILIFILGETARAANFSLGDYPRETNPLLAKQDIIYFHNVESCGTATATSVPCMFSSLQRSNFDSADARYTENVIDLLQKSGYKIIWKENDNGCKSVCDRVPDMEDMVQTNNPKYCNGSYCLDAVLLDNLEEMLKNIHQDTLIVLHTMGSHGPTYYQRYPEEFEKFTPTCDTADIQNCTQQQIINTYDNTILYTDYIVSSAIDILKKFPQYEAGILYVSDHGESLGENNVYLHGLPYKIAPQEQTQVPMVLWMNENMKKWDYVDYACMKKEAVIGTYSHDYLFHSILGLLEIDSKEYRPEYDLFGNCRTKPLPFKKEN